MSVVPSMRGIRLPSALHPITIEPDAAHVAVEAGGRTVADSRRTLVMREAAYPPVHYVPRDDVDAAVLVPSEHTSYCPFKGTATHYHLRVEDRLIENAAWSYLEPYDAVAGIAGHVAFYPDRVDAVVVAT